MGAVFGSILNLALWNMLIHVADNPSDKTTDVDYEKVVKCRIPKFIFNTMLHNLGYVVKPGQLHPMSEVYSFNWKANANTALSIVEACDGKYADFDILFKVVDVYLVTLEHVTKVIGDWSGAECIFCHKLLMSGLIGIKLCGQMFCHLWESKYCQVLCMGQTQVPCPM